MIKAVGRVSSSPDAHAHGLLAFAAPWTVCRDFEKPANVSSLGFYRADLFDYRDGIAYDSRTEKRVTGVAIRYKSGKVCEKGFYKNGKRNGLFESFHDNGRLFSFLFVVLGSIKPNGSENIASAQFVIALTVVLPGEFNNY